MYKKFQDFTEKDWEIFKQYIINNKFLYDIIYNKVKLEVITNYNTLISPVSRWNGILEFAYLPTEDMHFKSLSYNHTYNKILSSNLIVNIEIKINNKQDNISILSPEDISFIITIDPFLLNDILSSEYYVLPQIYYIKYENIYDYEYMIDSMKLFYITLHLSPDDYIEYITYIMEICNKICESYNKFKDSLRSEFRPLFNVIYLRKPDLQEYMLNNFNWTVEFEGDKIVSVKFE